MLFGFASFFEAHCRFLEGVTHTQNVIERFLLSEACCNCFRKDILQCLNF